MSTMNPARLGRQLVSALRKLQPSCSSKARGRINMAVRTLARSPLFDWTWTANDPEEMSRFKREYHHRYHQKCTKKIGPHLMEEQHKWPKVCKAGSHLCGAEDKVHNE